MLGSSYILDVMSYLRRGTVSLSIFLTKFNTNKMFFDFSQKLLKVKGKLWYDLVKEIKTKRGDGRGSIVNGF